MKYEVRRPTGELLGTLRGPPVAKGQRQLSFDALTKSGLTVVMSSVSAYTAPVTVQRFDFNIDYWRLPDGRGIPMLLYEGKVSHLSRIQGFWRA